MDWKREAVMDIYEKYKKIEDLPVKTIMKKPEAGKNLLGVIHILHGMCEHKGRYMEMLEYFSSRGYAVVISDMRGHGENVKYIKDLGYFGDNGPDLLVEDVHAVNVFIHNTFPDLKVVLVAHSMGSIIGRAYLKRYDADVDFVFLSGTPSDNIGKYAGLVLSEIQSLIFEDSDNSRLIDYLMYNGLKRRFRNEQNNCWISKDRAVVEEYNSDERCNFKFKINGYNTLFRLMIRIYSKRGWAVKNKKLPVCFIVGNEDVYAVNEVKLRKQVKFLKDRGYKNVSCHIFDNMRHEIFNEKDHIKVWDYMLNKLEKRL